MGIIFSLKRCLDLVGIILRVPDQSGISRLYNMLETYHSAPEPWLCPFRRRFVIVGLNSPLCGDACSLWEQLVLFVDILSLGLPF